MLSDFFAGKLHKNKTKRLSRPSNATKSILKERLGHDFALYDFIKQLFYTNVKRLKELGFNFRPIVDLYIIPPEVRKWLAKLGPEALRDLQQYQPVLRGMMPPQMFKRVVFSRVHV